MPDRCIVPLCKGNYPTGPKVSVYKFPKDQDLIRKWLSCIQRKDFYPSKSSHVCELHFKDSDFERETYAYDDKTGRIITVPLTVRRLKQTAVPSIFPNYPTGNACSTTNLRKCPEEKRLERDMENLKKVINESCCTYDQYTKSREIKCLNDIIKCVKNFGMSTFWSFHQNDEDNTLFFLHMELKPEPFIQYSVKITDSLDLVVFMEKTPIPKLSNYVFPLKLQNYNDILKLLEFIENTTLKKEEPCHIKSVIELCINLLDSIIMNDNENLIKFIQQQLNLLLSSKSHFRYSTDLLVFACILKSISPHAYNFVRHSGNVILPHPDTLKRVCNNFKLSPQLELNDENFLMYITSRVNFINEHEKLVTLLVDEIHIKPYFDYKGGAIVGSAFHSDMAATSAFVFMVSSILSPFKEVVYILPVSSLNSQNLYQIIKKVIIGLEHIGLKVVCVLTDNNSINCKAMSLFTEPPQKLFVYLHPFDLKRPLFFLIDSVHIFKNIRNNWLNQKNYGRCFYYPNFDDPENQPFKTASFMALKKLYDIENNEIIKYAKGLTLKSIAPSSLERQNVSLVLKIFNNYVIQALLTLGPAHNIEHYKDTADFIDIISKWWNVFNVKTPDKGRHQRNVFMEPLNADESNEKNKFLSKFLDWLDAWDKMNCTTGALSKETHRALVQTTHGMLELKDYCIDQCKLKYILTGKIQTDCLEARFSKYREMAGSQYHISLRQLLECEKKLRLQSSIKLELAFNTNIVTFTHFDEDSSDNISNVPINITNFINLCNVSIADEIDNVRQYLPILTYLGGYCSHSAIKKLKCNHCKESLVLDSDVNIDENYKLIHNLDRGGLKCPTQYVVMVVTCNYIVVQKLCSDFHSYAKMGNQKQIAVKLTFDLLKSNEIVLENKCPNGHDNDYICKLLLSASTNTMLKNICAKENDAVCRKKEDKALIKKRKLQTLQK